MISNFLCVLFSVVVHWVPQFTYKLLITLRFGKAPLEHIWLLQTVEFICLFFLLQKNPNRVTYKRYKYTITNDSPVVMANLMVIKKLRSVDTKLPILPWHRRWILIHCTVLYFQHSKIISLWNNGQQTHQPRNNQHARAFE